MLGGLAWMYLWIFLWSLIPVVGIVFGVIRAYEYRFTPYILMTRDDVKPTEAIKVSKAETMGYKGKMFGADMLAIGAWMGGIAVRSLRGGIPDGGGPYARDAARAAGRAGRHGACPGRSAGNDGTRA